MTEEKSERKDPAKKGLHGWKAATAIFGCGTFAAFGIFGLIVAIIGTLVNSISNGLNPEAPGVDGEVAAPAPTLEAREEFLGDKFDLCSITLPSIDGSGVVVNSPVDDPVDTSLEGDSPAEDNLVRSGECEGILHPGAAISAIYPWDFHFSYSAIIYAPENNREELARGYFSDWRSEIDSLGIQVEEKSDFDFLESSYYVYGSSGEGEGNEYALVSIQRSAVLMIRLSSSGDTSAPQFASEVSKLERGLTYALDDLIPA